MMATEKRLIYLDEALEATHKEVWWTESEASAIRSFLLKLPRADAAEVVHCENCVNHGNCLPEDVFRIARIEKPYCCAGKMDGDGNG